MAMVEQSAALLEAVGEGSARKVQAALEVGASANAADAASGLTPLMLAAGYGHAECAAMLIAAGALVNAVDPRAGATALHKACQGGHLDVVRVLVKAGALVNIQAASTGHTPLVEAIWFKADGIVEFLLDQNARIELNTYYGFTTDQHIQYAKMVNSGAAAKVALDRIERLVEARRARDRSAQMEQTLNLAILDKDLQPTLKLQAVRDALAAGADVEQRWPIVGSFQDGHTPLLIASRDGHIDVVQELVNAGAKVNAIEPIFGAVPLHKATYHGYAEITQILARASGVDLDYQGPSNGYTPLHDALWHAKADCASILLDAGARTDIVAYDGKLPKEIAVQELGADHPIVSRL